MDSGRITKTKLPCEKTMHLEEPCQICSNDKRYIAAIFLSVGRRRTIAVVFVELNDVYVSSNSRESKNVNKAVL